eukprot:SAG31_NODE_839_length_11600_cov_3.351013_7_plen_60_part_00
MVRKGNIVWRSVVFMLAHWFPFLAFKDQPSYLLANAASWQPDMSAFEILKCLGSRHIAN